MANKKREDTECSVCIFIILLYVFYHIVSLITTAEPLDIEFAFISVKEILFTITIIKSRIYRFTVFNYSIKTLNFEKKKMKSVTGPCKYGRNFESATD